MLFDTRRARGNILFILLVAIVLIAGLTYAITRSDGGSGNLTRERLVLGVGQVSSFAIDMKRAVANITRTGHSESSISFAHANLTGYGTPDTAPETEVFNLGGGGVGFITVPAGMQVSTAQWEFFGFTAVPGVGDEAVPDLIMVAPNVTADFCHAYNEKAGYAIDAAIPTDSAQCLYDTSKRFSGTFATSGINTMDAASFTKKPANFACVACGTAYHAYYVLLER